jgi:zinc/manganese transport system ATP-binding protein
MNAIEFDKATLRLGDKTVLERVSLAVKEGEFIGVLGPNGAGKTTLLKAILGLVPPAAGRIQVLGSSAGSDNAAVGYMPQVRRGVAGLGLRGRDFVRAAAGGARWGLPWSSAAERRDTDAAIEAVGAADLARRPLNALSGGERQRLLLAQALLGRPRLLLLDEPLISLDPAHQADVVELVKRLRDQQGLTVLFTAHELNPLVGSIDRVLYLGHGQAALGPVEEVITGPVLSRLYGGPIEVQRLGGRIFVLSGGHDVERAEHHHDA